MEDILADSGYETISAGNGEEALRRMEHRHVDLIIADVMMPGMDGYTLTSQLRESNFTLPILMVTAKITQPDKKKGFLVGVDDYMTKPVDEEEMLLRIAALLRRSKIATERRLQIGKTELIYDSRTVIQEDREIRLPQKEFLLLYKLLAYPGKTFTRRQLMNEVWDLDTESEEVPWPQMGITILFNQMTAELGGTEMMRTDFINTFSHEFKTPIVSIRGFARRLQRENLTSAQRAEYLEYIVRQSERLSELSANILLLCRYENQQMIGTQETYELDEQLRRCILLLENQWEAKNIQFDVRLSSLKYKGNEEMLDHVWLNMIGNAVKFSPEGGSVKVLAASQGDWLYVDIADEGEGMIPGEIEHMFDKFYQGNRGRALGGNGLGLPLAKRIVDLCGGRIEAESTEGKGTTFHILLPCS